MNKLEIVYKNPKDLVPYEKNARTHSESQISQIAQSITTFGFNNPILLDSENMVIAGHARLSAAKSLNIEKVPTINIAHLSEAQKKAYILADNKLALLSGWDNTILEMELLELKSLDIDLTIIGFSDLDLNKYMGGNSDKVDGTTGAKELDQSEFEEFAHVCPKCKFEFN